MRRMTATLLLFFLGIFPVVPLLADNSQANLPACCRRTGKHHCMEHMTPSAPDGTHFKSAAMKCPMFPASAPIPGHNTQVLLNASQSFYGAIVAHPAIHAQIESFYRICWSRSQQKRGPPSFLS
jgi:hypothetical protein